MEDQVSCADEGRRPGHPKGRTVGVEGLTTVLYVLRAVTSGELGLAIKVPLANMTGDGVAIAISSDILLEMLLSCFLRCTFVD